MAKLECRGAKECRMAQMKKLVVTFASSFGLRASFVIRHSDFVISGAAFSTGLQLSP
jgi:hypothetical protein